MKKYSYYVRLEGLNFDRLFKKLNSQNISIYNYNRPNYKTCEFGISLYNFYKLKKQNVFKDYKITVLKCFGLGFFINTFFKNVGMYVGAVLVFAVLILVSKTTLKINILGLENIKEEQIVELLNSINVKTGKINTVTNEEIEQYLKQNNQNISLVSVVKKGTNIIINIKEKIEKTSQNISPICAPYNLVVNSIEVLQGVAKVKVGDIVKKGDILVEAKSIVSNGETTFLTPKAVIDASVWITGSVELKNEEVIYKKTGKKQVISSFEFCKFKLFSTTNQVKFENYEKKVYNNYVFKNMFLPLKLNKIVYYETKAETIKNNFEQVKTDLINKSKQLAYSKLPKGNSVLNENVVVSKTTSGHIVTTYLEIKLLIEG